MKTAGDRLQFARAAAGFKSARSAAMEFGWPLSTYNAHERAGYPGSRNFTVEDAQKYGRIFGVSAAWLLTGEGAPPRKEIPDGMRLANKSRPDPAETFPIIPANVPLPVRQDMPLDVPVLGTAEGGDGDDRFQMAGDIIDHVRRPPGIANAKDAFALYVRGESMYPVYQGGDLIYLRRNLPARVGGDVVIEFRSSEGEGGEGLLKRFIRRTPTKLIVEQFNPAKELEFDLSDVKAVHRVLTLSELMGV